MNASLRALLLHVIDYAALFPPAKLPLDQAIRDYARYWQAADVWMLGRFVIPAAALGSLIPYRGELTVPVEALGLAVVGRGGESHHSLKEALAADIEAGRGSVGLPIRAWEVRGPLEPESVTAAAMAFAGLNQYYEISLSDDWQSRLSGAVVALADFNSWRTYSHAGFKLRCGGLEPSAFPSVEHVAHVLSVCRDARVPLKFTAGLHHPIRRFDAALQTHMHGFVNVFVAGVLAHSRNIDEQPLRAVLADEDAADFSFTDAGLSWKDHFASTAAVAAARRHFVTSFGSCSFDEPRDDLRTLGWL